MAMPAATPALSDSNPPGIELLDEEYRSLIVLPPDVLSHGQVLRSIDDPKVMELYNKAWDRVNATEARIK